MTARELSNRTGLSIGRISQLTKGWRKGDKQYPAVLIENVHYKRNYGRIEYFETSFLTLTQERIKL